MALRDYLEAARRIPRGETATFAELAALAGRPGAARAAGRAIAACPIDADVPWHRVVAADGSLARDPARARIQRERLLEEGARLGKRPVAREAPAAPRRRSAGLAPPSRTIAERLDALDWPAHLRDLAASGLFRAPGLLAPSECARLIELWDVPGAFARRIEMEPRGYGVGSYRYFAEPLPDPAGLLRHGLYERLAPAASAIADGRRFPPGIEAFWDLCRASGQERTSSILLRYAAGGINYPHRDVYGPVAFPFQAVVLLSSPSDYAGGELALWRETPGGEEVERTLALGEGELCVFRSRRHGMARVTSGERFALGIVFHLAE